jgi:hypothetical protein
MDLIGLLISIIIIGLVFWLIYWLIGMLPLPEPFKTVAYVILVLIAVIYLLSILPGIPHTWHR